MACNCSRQISHQLRTSSWLFKVYESKCLGIIIPILDASSIIRPFCNIAYALRIMEHEECTPQCGIQVFERSLFEGSQKWRAYFKLILLAFVLSSSVRPLSGGGVPNFLNFSRKHLDFFFFGSNLWPKKPGTYRCMLSPLPLLFLLTCHPHPSLLALGTGTALGSSLIKLVWIGRSYLTHKSESWVLLSRASSISILLNQY